MPGQSRYAEAVADDEEAAELFLAMGGKEQPKHKMRLADWTPEVAELRVIGERLAVLGQLIAATGQLKSPPKFSTLPRPETAAERVRYRKALKKHQELVRALIPDRSDLTTGG